MELVTGGQGKAHIRSVDAGAFNAGIFGNGGIVLNTLTTFHAEIINNNTVRIHAGDLSNQGRHMRIRHGEYEDLNISNGTEGQSRYDLIVARYEMASDGTESAKLSVIKGTSTAGTPVDPDYTQGDTLTGALVDEFPLYRVKISGTAIEELEKLFDIAKDMSGLISNDDVYKFESKTLENVDGNSDFTISITMDVPDGASADDAIILDAYLEVEELGWPTHRPINRYRIDYEKIRLYTSKGGRVISIQGNLNAGNTMNCKMVAYVLFISDFGNGSEGGGNYSSGTTTGGGSTSSGGSSTATEKNNVLTYGADASGNTYADDAILEAIQKNAGGSIYFPPGYYKISSPIKTYGAKGSSVSIILDEDAKIFTDAALECILDTGALDVDSTDYYVGNRKVIRGGTIDAENCTYAVIFEENVKDYVFETNCINCTNGILCAREKTSSSQDLYIQNCIITGKNSDYEGDGITINSSDNTVDKCRIYKFRKTFVINGSATYLSNVHDLKVFAASTSDSSFTSIFQKTKFAEVLSGVTNVKLSGCYADSDYCFIDMQSNGVLTIEDCYYYSYISDVDVKLFNITNSYAKFVINNCNFTIPTPKTKSIGINYTASDPQTLLRDTSFRYTNNTVINSQNLIYGDILKGIRTKVIPFVQASKKFTLNSYYKILSFIPILYSIAKVIVRNRDTELVAYIGISEDSSTSSGYSVWWVRTSNSSTSNTYKMGLKFNHKKAGFPVFDLYVAQSGGAEQLIDMEVFVETMPQTFMTLFSVDDRQMQPEPEGTMTWDEGFATVIQPSGIPASGGGSSSGTDGTYYVTPEMFGAKGDGATDDTNAFLQAIQTEKPIVCKSYTTYYFKNPIILPNLTNINIYGNNCTLKNFALKINVNDDETSWNSGESYPQPESIIKNVLFDNIEMDYCIKTGIPLKLQNIKFNNYGSCLKNYGPYMDYMVLDNIIIVYHTGTEYAIDLAYLGDQHVFKELHCIGDFSTEDFANKFIRISGCNSAKFENCILNGFVDIYDSTVIFDSCHMENPGGIGLGEDADSSNIKFLGCFFWDMFKMPNGKYVEYDSCNIYLTHQAYGNGTNDYLALNTHNTSIDIGDTQSFGRMSLDAYTRKEYESEYSESLCILDSSPLAESGSKNWSLETGTYKYTFFPSNNPLSIENSDYSKSKKELNVTVNSDTSQVRFYVNESYDFIWCYRTSPSGIIKRAICTCETKLWDFGESINGILWTNVNKIPEPMKSIVNIKNDIYYSEDGNVNANNVLVVNQSAKSITYKVGESVNYVNYILSDGSQWIDTGIIPDGNTEIEYKFQDDTRTDEWENIFGSSSSSYCVNRYNNWSQTFVLRVNDTETLFEVSEEKQQNGCTIKISNAEKTIYLDNISVGTFSASVNATDSIVLFARRWEASGSNMVDSNGIFKLYYFAIKQNGETVRDFRPAIDEDGVVCLYDNITNKYYYNAGTGLFDYG